MSEQWDEYQRLAEAFDSGDRCAEPPDCSPICRIEVDFGIPVVLSDEHQRKLNELIRSITDAPWNAPKNGVHWASGYGSRPKWSRSDAAFLGVAADPDAPDSGEPEFDDSILHIETTCRAFVSEKERQRVLKRREKKGV